MSPYKVLFKVSGSVAAFKACEVISQLRHWGCEVRVIATKNALKFIGPSTFEGLSGHKVLIDTFEAGHGMDHIYLGNWADLTIFCPATANSINKLSQGIADDLVGTAFLAHDFSKPYYLVPAMNTKMWNHPSTQSSLKNLKNWGVKIIEPGHGQLACGEAGIGRLAEPGQILNHLFLEIQKKSTGPRVLITAGGTREQIDGVRSIANTSSGKTGSEIANALTQKGCKVTFVGAEHSIRPTFVHRFLSFSDFNSLNKILSMELQNHYDQIIHCAAVSDYSVDKVLVDGQPFVNESSHKITSRENLDLHLKKNFKIIDRLKEYSKNKSIQVIGFKLTNTLDIEEREKSTIELLDHSHADFVVHNDLNEIRMGKPLYTLYKNPNQKISVSKNLSELIGGLELI